MAKKKAPIKVSVSVTTDSVAETPSTKTTSTTASGFAIQAYKNGILASRFSEPPSNIRAIHENNLRHRHSPSPTESEYKEYVRDVKEVCNEATLLITTNQKLLKKYRDEGYSKVFKHAFSGFPRDSGVNAGLSPPQPDFIEGLEMQKYSPFPIDEHIKGAVLYEDDPYTAAPGRRMDGSWEGYEYGQSNAAEFL